MKKNRTRRLSHAPILVVADLVSEEVAEAQRRAEVVERLAAERDDVREQITTTATGADRHEDETPAELAGLRNRETDLSRRIEAAEEAYRRAARNVTTAAANVLQTPTGTRRIRDLLVERPAATRLAAALEETAAALEEVADEDSALVAALVGAGLLPSGLPVDRRRFPAPEFGALRSWLSLPDVVVDAMGRLVSAGKTDSPFVLRGDEVDEISAARLRTVAGRHRWDEWQEKTGTPRPVPATVGASRSRATAARRHAVSAALSAAEKNSRPRKDSPPSEVPEATREEVPA